ncbi:unnamed protein product (macronuclear) [Paramecium tetraurelia]|uniref:CSN8/PSMD8/EIF3K domain-containing protein n=1 Tax=Paramecium tetraurelia TaxID=5888 RepID=A0DI13_PARTE|nr:uncharacterized protein GSPATT00017051001 [Paramecium tetraurelia]CAK82680.1 unnamed protein product [Paramecium tetraurelia]|eukprot:XP_001450077.1 hypothetical protein (macronuclear) [Paramecium tetraurelia strain d4-2]
MSLLSKFTSIFGSNYNTQASDTPLNQQLQEVLTQILKANNKIDLKQKSELLAQYLLEKEEHIEYLFSFLQTTSKDLNPLSVVHLLSVIHQQFQYNELIQDVAIKLRETKMPWIQLEKHEWQSTKTEPDLPKKQQSQIILTEFEDSSRPAAIYAQLCYVYLQRLAANIDLYRAVSKFMYPYVSDKDQIEPKLMFLWHYKIQNLINSGLILLQYDQELVEIQTALYQDVWKFQKFICVEIEKIIDQYVTLPSSDTLSLYEIYQESTKHYEILLKFHQFTQTTTEAPRECHFNNVNLQEFLGFVSKLKLLNLPNFKKKIKVPNKGDPGMGVPTRNPKVRHLKHQSNQFLVNDTDSSDSDGVADINPQIIQKIKNKTVHLRGESTFQQKYK